MFVAMLRLDVSVLFVAGLRLDVSVLFVAGLRLDVSVLFVTMLRLDVSVLFVAGLRLDVSVLFVAGLRLDVAVLVAAHHCFTLASDMAGICELLKQCKTTTTQLQRADMYDDMVRQQPRSCSGRTCTRTW